MATSINSWDVHNGEYRVSSSSNPHNLSNQTPIRFSVGEGGALPTGVSADTTYYVFSATGSSSFRFKFSTNSNVSSASQCVQAEETPPDDTSPTYYEVYSESSSGSMVCSGTGTFTVTGSGTLTVQ